ncbi:hypothetical protein FHX42_003903 [Saccharopolyspora lacisalsi]|uniref:Uncharacterized protein n=1 Tax=Halosaccharopolyspora lacisalsi TaxID=1000566 RepID=A0A839E469_9PSEU|nr:hypothetical protein [Halosaccharopolyspora lacisalsi]MBA8826527.1 hypothetical protein [Halosaccharopolyspora lacisalsi]
MSTPLLLEALVDDAGLFPPTALDMPAAVVRHRADQRAEEPMLTHRLLCPAGRIGELRSELADTDRVRLGLITDRGPDGLDEVLDEIDSDPRLELSLLEVPLAKFGGGVPAALRALDRVSAEVAAYFEPAAVDGIDDVATELAESESRRRLGGKLRCGGVRAELFPSAEQVARFLSVCARVGIPLKATAGLHQAVRHGDPVTGFVHHGYLNLLLAAASASDGADEGRVREALTVTDPAELARRIGELDRDAVSRTRSVLVSYGSCSTSTPIGRAREVLEATERQEVQ